MTSSSKGAKPSKKQLSEWACPEGECDVTNSICPHIEALLPNMRAGDPPRSVPSDAAARASMSFHQTLYPKYSLDEFRTLLRNYGFTDSWDLELLVSAYFYRERQSMIAKEYGVDQSVVSRRLKTLRKLLEERGFSQEMQ